MTAIIHSELLGQTSEPEKPVKFHADHPFLCALRYNATGAILFVGRVVDPAS